MKKFIMISIIALTVAGFIGCGDTAATDSSKADLKWSNNAADYVTDIKWISDGKEDQSWDGQTAAGAETAFKGINELAGSGDCIDNTGESATIELDSTSTGVVTAVATGDTSAVIEENASAVLVISNTAKK